MNAKGKGSKGARPKGGPAVKIGLDGDRFAGLSEEERKGMLAMSGSDGVPIRPPAMTVDDPGALRKRIESLVHERDGLKEDLDKTVRDLKKAEDELKGVKGELTTAERNLNTNRDTVAGLRDELESKKESIRTLTAERDALADRVKTLESGRPDPHVQYSEKAFNDLTGSVEALKKEKAGLEGRIGALEARNAELTGELDASRAEAERLGGELDSLRERIEVERTSVVVVRDDENRLSSSRFEDGNYDVRLGPDLSYMTFRKDPNGKALCWRNSITLPKLKAYVPFEKRTSYEGEEAEGMIRIQLVRRCRGDIGRC